MFVYKRVLLKFKIAMVDWYNYLRRGPGVSHPVVYGLYTVLPSSHVVLPKSFLKFS